MKFPTIFLYTDAFGILLVFFKKKARKREDVMWSMKGIGLKRKVKIFFLEVLSTKGNIMMLIVMMFGVVDNYMYYIKVLTD